MIKNQLRLLICISYIQLLHYTGNVHSQIPPKMKNKALPEAYRPIEGDWLWMMTTELSNKDYKEFLFWAKKNKSAEEYKNLLPDTLVWRARNSYNEPYVEYYFRHPAYMNYPVVGISRAQAQAYCDFATQAINQYLALSQSPVEQVVVRIPTEKEWELAARAGNIHAVYPWGTPDVRFPHTDKKFAGQMRANFVRSSGDYTGVAGALNDAADVTAPVESYWPNPWGFYNMAGNVAEWIDQPGVAKGGGWSSAGYDIRIDQKLFCDSVAPNIGFRPLLEVVKFKEPSDKKPLKLTADFIEKQLIAIPASSYTTGGSESDSDEYRHRSRTVSVASFHISKYEVTNALYNIFLNDIKSINPESVLKYTPRDSNWLLEKAPLHYLHYSNASRFADYPVVNISYMAAKAFCLWLNEKYQGFENRKFREVVFSLPVEEEWELAARGNFDLAPYPWGGPYEFNNKGQYLANYNPVRPEYVTHNAKRKFTMNYPDKDSTLSRLDDGFLFTAPVSSFHPNGYGLYNMSGNACEMILGTYSFSDYEFSHDLPIHRPTDTDTLSLVRGGSFASMPWQITTYWRDFEEPERMKRLGLNTLPTVGFRFMMREIPGNDNETTDIKLR